MDKERADKIQDLANKLNKLVRVKDALESKKPNRAISVTDQHGNDIYLDDIEGMTDGMIEKIEQQIKTTTKQIKQDATE